MGYGMSQSDSDIRIKAENVPAALAAILGMYEPDESGGFHTYSWVDRSSVQISKTLIEALNAWRWRAYERSNGDIYDFVFDGEKLGSEVELFSTIAPFIEHGSYIEMVGEDDSRWRWVFWRGELREEYPEIIWKYEQLTVAAELIEGVDLE
jgi:hypothetical protein